jgi:hypothetical protein
MNRSTCATPRWPETRMCSGQGRCLITSIIASGSSNGMDNSYLWTCQCNDGWWGRGDTINRDGYDCNVHRQSVHIIHWIALIYGIFLIMFLIISIYRLRHRNISRSTPSPSVNYNHNHAAEAAAVGTFIPLPGVIAAGSGGGVGAIVEGVTAAVNAVSLALPSARGRPHVSASASIWRDRLCPQVSEPPQRAVLLGIFYALFDIIYFALRVSDEQMTVATHPSIAALWMIDSSLFFAFAAFFLWIVVQSVITPLQLSAAQSVQVIYVTRLMKVALVTVGITSLQSSILHVSLSSICIWF